MKGQLDWFLADIVNTELEVSDELFEALVQHATNFLMAGGVMTWERYAMLGEASREAFKQAASNLKIRSALETK